MIANKAYAYDFNIPAVEEDYVPSKKDFKIIKSPKIKTEVNTNVQKQLKSKSKLSLILSVVAIFTMLIIISYRYNVISEKNLELQRLKINKSSVESELATTAIATEKMIDKDMVESYAKQQLGMQKPEKSQIVYINSKYETKVEEIENNNIFEKVVDKLKNIIGM